MTDDNAKPENKPDEAEFKTQLELKFLEIITPFQRFASDLIIGSMFLIVMTIVALLCANIPFLSPYYDKLIKLQFMIHFGTSIFGGTLKFWVNHFLLTFFFFLVGLEIKREFIAGQLKDRKQALFTILAALGGMLVPSIIYILFNHGTETVHGWGIPMATDTAFALGVMSLFRKRLPNSIFTYIAALAIIDDIGAIIIITMFYSDTFSVTHLLYACIPFSMLILGNFLGIRNTLFYLIVGSALWVFIDSAGIHSTIAGVLIAFCIPARPEQDSYRFRKHTKKLLEDLENRQKKAKRIIEDQKQHNLITQLERTAKQATTPLQYLASVMELPISLFILPIFAFFNAGVMLKTSAIAAGIFSPLTLGIIVGLFIGKPIGINLFTYLAIKLNIGTQPKDTTPTQLIGVSLLAGIGFTMSLFIALLAFPGRNMFTETAKVAILSGSFLSAIVGVTWLFLLTRSTPKPS